MSQNCPNCKLVNFPNIAECARCSFELANSRLSGREPYWKTRIWRRVGVCLVVIAASIIGFYASLLFSARTLSVTQQTSVENAVAIIRSSGFSDEAFLLEHVAAFRGSDNWLNASVAKEGAYAATNFPFEIVTVYPDFFTYPSDDTERAAILLHEAKHLQGADEKEAYEFVWKNRKRLGWTEDKYRNSVAWQEIRKQTREYSPNLFVCDFNEFGDCTK